MKREINRLQWIQAVVVSRHGQKLFGRRWFQNLVDLGAKKSNVAAQQRFCDKRNMCSLRYRARTCWPRDRAYLTSCWPRIPSIFENHRIVIISSQYLNTNNKPAGVKATLIFHCRVQSTTSCNIAVRVRVWPSNLPRHFYVFAKIVNVVWRLRCLFHEILNPFSTRSRLWQLRSGSEKQTKTERGSARFVIAREGPVVQHLHHFMWCTQVSMDDEGLFMFFGLSFILFYCCSSS